MAQYDNTNRISIFKNDRKDTETKPDYTGTLNVEGREFWVSCWLKEGAKGKFFSGSIKPKDAVSTPKPTITSGRYEAPLSDVIDEDIPF